MTRIKDIIKYLEGIAPNAYQESYDNAGLIVGDPEREVSGVICSLDATEEVVAEAAAKGCNLVVAHHPIVFRGLKSLTGRNYVERTVIRAIREDVAIFAIHTNLDNVYAHGVNERIGQTLGLKDTRILAPKTGLRRLEVRLDEARANGLSSQLEAHGLSHLQIDRGQAESGQGVRVRFRYASVEHQHLLNALQALGGQPPLISSWDINETNPDVGSGLIGRLEKPMTEIDFLHLVKDRMQCGCIRHTAPLGQPVERVALCGGAGGFLLSAAIRAGADAFITADYKYHEFFDADSRILLADIGHYESEQYTIDLLQELLSKKFRNFAAYCTEVRTNPVQYLV